MASHAQFSRDQLAQDYFEQLPYEPYPVQQEALLAWFTAEQGVLVCAPTGTGKTLIAEAAVYEALRLGKPAYYTTPLIALTDQKFHELQHCAVKWGFSEKDIGLVTGNRKVNPQAKILVVVAEILLNRLLHRDAFDFSDVWAVVMDEFHSFNDRDRGIVWEFGLGLLPLHVRTLLLSATVGNALEFSTWLDTQHRRRLQLVQSLERKVPLSYEWIEDCLLSEQIESMISGEEANRRTPALLFCFNREQCWTVAEQLKGKRVVDAEQQRLLGKALEAHDWSQGAGPKLKQILVRGIGVHHAGVLPRYRRIVEQLFQERLLSVCVCTETLAAGINLPARSIVLPTLLKGPPGKMKLIEPSAAHQMFGRAGRPQFDDRGFVYALPHDDDVKILRWQAKLDQIPSDTKDIGLLKARKQLKKKMPKRREGFQYWTRQQFELLISSPPASLSSRGPLPWRLLAYMLDASSEVEPIRQLVSKRLLKGKAAEGAQHQLHRMLLVLERAGFVHLHPKPPVANQPSGETTTDSPALLPPESSPFLDLGQRRPSVEASNREEQSSSGRTLATESASDGNETQNEYRPEFAYPTEKLADLLFLRGVHPLYGVFLIQHLGIADSSERLQALESLLELPRSLGPAIRVPPPDELPPGPLAATRLNPELLRLGLASAEELGLLSETSEEDGRGWIEDDQWVRPLTLAQKLYKIFEHEFPEVTDARVWPCWVAGSLLEFGGDFNSYITSQKLQKQEGMVFRHLLRLVLLIDELAQLCPPELPHQQWQDELGEIADQIESCCRQVDPRSTEQWLDQAKNQQDL